ncbi:hypothetical protein [Endozoicomonas sp. YOMI1]|uniref:hypothetical protein n=1 Tax=Endozoicomonas sp. YOMI1 TaxID=2828739 RepID=UPI0021497CA9|nr:hypothetical protein [Endozoicomonas sp. YOMI1]
METQRLAAPTQNCYAQLEKGLTHGVYQLEQQPEPYIKFDDRVVCIQNDRIAHLETTLNNINLAHKSYRKLPGELQELAQRKVNVCQDTQPEVSNTTERHSRVTTLNPEPEQLRQDLAASAHQRFDNRLPDKSKRSEPSRPTSTQNSLTDAQLRELQELFKNGIAFFNDDLRAITSLNQRTTFCPTKHGCFEASPAPMELPDYEKVKSQYEHWKTSSSTVSTIKTPFATGLQHSARALHPRAKTTKQPESNQPEKELSPSALTFIYDIENNTVSSKEQQIPAVIPHYFSGYKTTFDNFITKHKVLCDHMREQEVFGKLEFPELKKDTFKDPTSFEFENQLYQMFMVEETKETLSKLITRYESSCLPTKKQVALEIAKLCIQKKIKTHGHQYSCKDSCHQAREPQETESASASTAVTQAKPTTQQRYMQAIRILKAHRKDALDVSQFLKKNYDDRDFSSKLEIKQVEINRHFCRKGGPAQIKDEILAGFKHLVESETIINTTTGDLKIPAAVAADPEDMECFQTFAGIIFDQYKKLDTSKTCRDRADYKDMDFLIGLCEISLQTMELLEKCAKKQSAKQSEKHTLQS